MKNLDKVILEMTKEIEEMTIEWIFQAINKTLEIDSIRFKIVEQRLLEKYPNDRRARVYAQPNEMKDYIDETIGLNVFTVGNFYKERGVRRGSREEVVLKDVAKEYEAKRRNLKNKILKLAGDDKITEISSIVLESDSKLGCTAYLDCGDKIEIFTVEAGGWNIQKFHFRGLAKRISIK